MRQLAKAGCKKVFREVASGAKIKRAQLRRLLAVIDAGDLVTGDAARPAAAAPRAKESTWAAPLPETPAQQKEATRRRAQGATLQELANSYDRSISTMRRATRTA